MLGLRKFGNNPWIIGGLLAFIVVCLFVARSCSRGGSYTLASEAPFKIGRVYIEVKNGDEIIVPKVLAEITVRKKIREVVAITTYKEGEFDEETILPTLNWIVHNQLGMANGGEVDDESELKGGGETQTFIVTGDMKELKTHLPEGSKVQFIFALDRADLDPETKSRRPAKTLIIDRLPL